MSFSRKVFLALFGATLAVGSTLLWSAHHLVSKKARDSYESRYTVFSRVLGNTLTQLEHNTESLMFNAAQVVAREDSQRGPLKTETLKDLRSTLNVTHIFVTDAHGQFIRSTNEDPSLIPNLFSFCDKYKNLVSGTETARGTPIIPPQPEPNPFKFITIANAARNRLIEVGVRVDFIGKTLSTAVKDDPNVLAINLYTPDGITLGSFDRGNTPYERRKVPLPSNLGQAIHEGNRTRVLLKVASTQTSCCQCDVAGISKAGEYYYVLETVISNAELKAALASITHVFLVLQLLALGGALFGARLLTRRLVSRIQFVTERVKEMGRQPGGRVRVGVTGEDEIGYLAAEFDGLLDRLDESQAELVEAQKAATAAEIASQVEHNMRSPIAAMEMTLKQLSGLPDQALRNIKLAIRDIKELAQALKTKSSASVPKRVEMPARTRSAPTDLILIPAIVEAVVSEKRIEYSNRTNVRIEYAEDPAAFGIFARVRETELRAILSNLVNNSADAISDSRGTIALSVTPRGDQVVISVTDTGPGIPDEVSRNWGAKGVTVGKKGGSGLGLSHAKATVESWGGSLLNESVSAASGATVSVVLPQSEAPAWFATRLNIRPDSPIVVLDDDELVHSVWRYRFKRDGLNNHVVHLKSPDELDTLLSADRNVIRSGAFLVDYDLKSSRDGLSVIEAAGIASNAVLVTGQADEAAVLQRAQFLGVKVLPKEQIGSVPVAPHK